SDADELVDLPRSRSMKRVRCKLASVLGAMAVISALPVTAQGQAITAHHGINTSSSTATISAAGDTYRACYVPTSGTIYRIGETGTPSECTRPTHVEFSWTKLGSPGPAGPQGATGPAGPIGPTGPQGTIGLDG